MKELLAAACIIMIPASAFAQGSVYFRSTGTSGQVAEHALIDKANTPVQADSFYCAYFAYPATQFGRQTIASSYPVGARGVTPGGIIIRHIQTVEGLRVQVSAYDDLRRNFIVMTSDRVIPESTALDAKYPYIGIAVNTRTQQVKFNIDGDVSFPDAALSNISGGSFTVTWNYSAWTVGAQRQDVLPGIPYNGYYWGLLFNIYCHAHQDGDTSIADDFTLTAVVQPAGPYTHSIAEKLPNGQIIPLSLGPGGSAVWDPFHRPTLVMIGDFPDVVGNFLDNGTNGVSPFVDVYGGLLGTPTHP